MDASFWQRIHGGSTHFPIVLLLASVVFDFVAWRSRDEVLRRGLHTAGFGSAVVGVLGGVGAVIAGLIMTRGQILGNGFERMHHLFVWPAFALAVMLVGLRLIRRGQMPHKPGFYLGGMGLAAVLMLGAGYSGGELLMAADNADIPAAAPATTPVADRNGQVEPGQKLFLKNCAHCHGADARGDEGPDLHGLDLTNEQIAARIRNGKKGQMTAFANKLSPNDITAVVDYLLTLK